MAKCVMLKSGGITDVTVGGSSVVADGVAKIPFGNTVSAGLVRFGTGLYISNRIGNLALQISDIDVAIKSAMCDSKGSKWKYTDCKAALARMGCTVGDDGTVKFTAQET